MKLDSNSIIALAGAGVAALWVWNQQQERVKVGSAANPVGNAYYVNPVLCSLFGKFCYQNDPATAGTTGSVPSPTPYPEAMWTMDPSTFWTRARKQGFSLKEACRMREPTPTGQANCEAAGWPAQWA